MTAPARLDGQPPDPRRGRFDRLARSLQVAMVLAALTAAFGDALHGTAGQVAEWILVGLLVGVPVLRVTWLVVRWFRRGDPKFAFVGIGVLVVMTVGVLASH